VSTEAGSSTLTYRISREAIGYLRFLLEGYEGLAQLSSVAGRDEIELLVPTSQRAELLQLLEAVTEELGLSRVESP
jgi:hypothetical protein